MARSAEGGTGWRSGILSGLPGVLSAPEVTIEFLAPGRINEFDLVKGVRQRPFENAPVPG